MKITSADYYKLLTAFASEISKSSIGVAPDVEALDDLMGGFFEGWGVEIVDEMQRG